MSKQAGIVLERSDVTILDTHAMEWENHFYEGTKTKVLSRDEHGVPTVQIAWIPAGTNSFSHSPERHCHSAVRERVLSLAGEIPIIEYDGFEDKVGERIVFKPGYYLDRGPCSVHGADPVNPAEVGFLSVEWRTGPQYLGEEGAENDIDYIDEPSPPRPGPAADVNETGGVVYERPNATILDTNAMVWEDHFYPGFKAKVLSRDENGAPSVQLVWMPSQVKSFAEKIERHAHTEVAECVLVLEGELATREFAGFDDKEGETVVFKPGYYLDRAAGSVHGADPARPSPVGALFLEWRAGPNYLGEDGAENDIEYLE